MQNNPPKHKPPNHIELPETVCDSQLPVQRPPLRSLFSATTSLHAGSFVCLNSLRNFVFKFFFNLVSCFFLCIIPKVCDQQRGCFLFSDCSLLWRSERTVKHKRDDMYCVPVMFTDLIFISQLTI